MVTRSIYVLNVQVYCEMERFNGGWNRVAYIDPAGQGYCPPRMQLRSEGDVKLCVFKEDRPNIFPVNADYKYVMGYVTGFAVSDIARHSQCWVLLDTLKRVRKDTQDTPPPQQWANLLYTCSFNINSLNTFHWMLDSRKRLSVWHAWLCLWG